MFELLRASRVIPAVRREEDIEAACASPGKLVYVLTGTVVTIGGIVERIHGAGKTTCVNADLVAGLAGHPAAAAFLDSIGADGIISTNNAVLQAARQRRLVVIQRTFLLDSLSVSNTCRSLARFVPDALEVLPAPVAPRAAPTFRAAAPEIAIIAGGLVASLAEIDELTRAGIDAVSVGTPSLWIV